ncbi:MAG: HAMP domain-containing histidine kinase [Ruminococcus sp.]|nr:HAMP domain-containing histidine kinase [Ruminococcus sp.]
MDRIDKFINNRPLKKILLIFFIMLIISVVISSFVAEKFADYIAKEQIKTYLSAVNNDELNKYGIDINMPPKLVPCWKNIWNMTFWIIFSAMGVCSFLWSIFSVHEIFGIYDSLETLSHDCINVANQFSKTINLQGNDADCIRRISESAELLVSRMNYLNNCLEYKKKYLSEFLNIFSHQIKTALTVIRLNMDIISETENLSAERYEELNYEIQLNLDSMENLVVQAIKLARLDSDTVEYNMENTALVNTCNRAVKRILPLLRSKNINIIKNIPESIMLNHDKGWVCEAVENILKNSADHSDCTEIFVELEENPAMVKLSFSDNGRGIPQEDIPKLFEKFAKKSGDITMKSAGLGMSIAQKIVRNHGGEIIVYSEIGKGTRFEFVFIKS